MITLEKVLLLEQTKHAQNNHLNWLYQSWLLLLNRLKKEERQTKITYSVISELNLD